MKDRRKVRSYWQTRKKTYGAIVHLKEISGCWKLKEEAIDHSLLRTRFGRGYGPVVKQQEMNVNLIISRVY
jgi:hypothetical protein